MKNNEVMAKLDISTGLPEPYDKVILVDCMDTIVYRDISLESLLALWAKRVGKEFNVYSKFLYNYRREVVASEMHNTVPIQVIYEEIFDHCEHFNIIQSCAKDDFIKKAHEIELEIELEHQYLIPNTVSLLKESKEKGAQIYCVSDFRLSANDITKFFSQQRIESLFNGVFSSCDVGKTKKDGDLYGCVLKAIGKDSSECIMIGDNYKSDCVNANKNGIKSYCVNNKKHTISFIVKDIFFRLMA